MAQPLRNFNIKKVLLVEPMLYHQLLNRKGAITTNVPKGECNYNESIPVDLQTLCKHGGLKEALHILHNTEQRIASLTYVCLLQGCITKNALSEGKLVHAHMNNRGFMPDTFFWNTLLNMYVKCGSLVDARGVFDQIPERDVFSWTVMIAAYARLGLAEEALILFRQMQRTGIEPNQFTFASIIPACTNLAALEQGKEIHEGAIRSGFQSDSFVSNTLAYMYAKCGSMDYARHVFDKMPNRDVVSWTAMIAGYGQHGNVDEALKMFQKMPQRDVVSWNAMIAAYAQNGNVKEALELFQKIPQRDVVSWNAMIKGHAQNGHGDAALKLFRQMQLAGMKPNSKTFASVLSACADLEALELGIEIHEEIIRSGFQHEVCVANALVDMYTKCGSIEKARELFDKMPKQDVVLWTEMVAGYAQNGHVDEALKFFQKMPERNVVSWTAMIAGYAQNGHSEEALKLFRQMKLAGVKPNSKTFASVLPACANLAALEQGMDIHEEIIRSGFQYNIFVANALVDMYAKCGSIENARDVFDKINQRDAISWTTMITGYAQSGHVDEAWKLFQNMPQRDVFSWNAMIALFAQSGHVEEALKLFQDMPMRDVISWTAIIAGYSQNGHNEAALKLFRQMQLAGVKPDSKTFASVLPACASLAAMDQGMEIHEEIVRNGFQSNIFVANALVDMYAKCGSIEIARDVFDKIHQRDIVSWNAIIAGYAMHGYGKEALKLFAEMQVSCMNPNHVTLLCVLFACCHAGLVDEGRKHFDCMSQYYHITPAIEHYGCMVDLLGRAGCLDEAHEFIKKMPIKPDATVWGCLLGACRIHNNIELGECAAECLFELDPKNPAPYVLLSNIYAAVDRWGDIEKVRKMMKDRSVRKTPGCSWIEVDKQIHTFLVGDRSYPQTQNIY
eukprot:Gb_27469 [translate_table: standard]